MHQASDVIAVVLDSELTPDQFCNAGGRPEIGFDSRASSAPAEEG